MKIGYLHLGSPEHGLHRYGRLLALEGKTRDHLSILEVNIQLKENFLLDLKALGNAARQLSEADVVHIQYNQAIWGREACAWYLFWFMVNCRAYVVTTLHDVYWDSVPNKWPKITSYLKAMYAPKALAIRLALLFSRIIFVCTDQEKTRLSSVDSFRSLVSKKLKIIPHFIENRTIEMTSTEARKCLGLDNARVITLLGWINRRKGHELMVQTIPRLPEDIKVIFAGKNGAGAEDFLEHLQDLALSLGVAERLTITGFLPEDKLNQYIAATDVAVCPFKKCSASGSIATWISAVSGKILAYNLPQIQDYNALEPEAISTFDSYTAESLSDAILQLLSESDHLRKERVQKLRDKLFISSIYDLHLKQIEALFI